MRSIEFYTQKLQQSTTLADVEKNLHSGLKQLETDRHGLISKRDRLLDDVKNIEAELSKTSVIEKEIVGLGQERIGQIMANLVPTLPKKRGRKPKAVVSYP